MKKGFRTVLLLSACLVLLAGCASEPKTQYNVNTQGAANTHGEANTPSTNTAGSSLPADYDPASEEDDYTATLPARRRKFICRRSSRLPPRIRPFRSFPGSIPARRPS